MIVTDAGAALADGGAAVAVADMGDRTLARLLEARPGLAFLGILRGALQEELVQVNRKVSEGKEGGRPCSFSN